MYAENTVYDTANVKKSNAYQTFQLSRDSWLLFFSDMDISASSQNHAANSDHCKYLPMNNSVSQVHNLKLKCVLRLQRTVVYDGWWTFQTRNKKQQQNKS